jgi:probable HAF family extracellular repeat protein
MQTKRKSFVLTVALAAVLLLAVAWPCAAAVPATTPTDLGVLAGCDYSTAIAINASGQVVGESFTADYSTDLPFIWQNGVMTALPLPSGSTGGIAVDINASGQVVGGCSMTVSSDYEACLWQLKGNRWTVTPLGVPSGYDGSGADTINGAGQVLAAAWTVDTGVACIWDGGEWTVLMDGETPIASMYPPQMNESGQVLGVLPDSSLVLWDNGTVTPIVQNIYNASMNNLGQVVGWYYDGAYSEEMSFIFLPDPAYGKDAGVYPVLASGVGYYGAINDNGQVLALKPAGDGSTTTLTIWDAAADSTSGLGSVSGYVESSYLTLNANGEVSGNWYNDNDITSGAFYASADAGVLLLNGLVEGAELWESAAMNDSGVIVGRSDTADGYSHAALWGPGLTVTVGDATATRKGRTIVVSVPITNTSTTETAYNVVVTAATLDAGTLTSALPSVRSIAPGATKTVTIKFSASDTASGSQELTVEGSTSSLGNFSRTQTVTVP